MKPHEVVFVEGLSWTKADKKAQISKVRAHARIVGLRTLELRREANPAIDRVRTQRRQATIATPGQERPLRPLASAAETPPDGPKPMTKTKSSLATLHSPTINSSRDTEDTPLEPDAKSGIQRLASPIEIRLDPDSYLRGYRKDPFNIIPANACQDALDFYTRYFAPNNAALYEIFNVTNIYTTFFFQLLQNPLCFHAGLANILHELEFFLNPAGKPSQRLYMLVGTALANLRREIDVRESLLDSISISAVMNLAVVARQLGDMEAHKLHKEHLQLMVKARGGLDALDSDGLQKSMVLQWEGYWCWAVGQGPTIFAEERPNPGAHEYPLRPFSENTRKLLSQLPVGFQDLAKQGLLTLPTLEVLGRAARALKYKENNIPVIRDEEVFAYKKRRYHDLMQACPSLADPADTPTLEKLVVTALILYCSATFCEVRLPTRHSTLTVVGATRDLSRLEIPITKAEMKALMWVYMVVIDGWRSRERRMQSPGVDLLRRFKARFPGTEHWEGVEEEVRKFFWTQDMGSFMSQAWADV